MNAIARSIALLTDETPINENLPDASMNPSMEEEIRTRAYEIYIERGGLHGSDQSDWFQAEREVKEKHKSRLERRGLSFSR